MIIVNGAVADTIPVMDRGLMYGDGVFRTLRVRNGQPELWQRQYAKLAQDCAALDILCPSMPTLEQEARELAAAEPNCVLKIIVSRGEGGRGYGVPSSVQPSRVMVTAPLPEYPAAYATEGVRLHLCEIRMCHQPRLAGIKHLNRLENVLARMEWSDPAMPEGLMLDPDGNVIEGTMSNILFRDGNHLMTPDLGRCGVAGLQRERILDVAPELGLQVQIGHFPLDAVLAADEVLVCNSLIGIWPVRAIGSWRWDGVELAAALQHKLGLNLG
jgi:4-amino-4-deoxychorismate lyase